MRARLEVMSSDIATLTLGDNPAERVLEMQSEGAGLTEKPLTLFNRGMPFAMRARTCRSNYFLRMVACG